MKSTVSLLAFLIMVVGMVGLVTTRSLVSWSPVAIAAQVAAVLLMAWARATFGARSFHAAATPTAGGIVTSGPYRYIRHPIYTAVCLFAWTGALANASPTSIAFAVLVTAGAFARMVLEEQLLLLRYPDYAAYARRTARMIPFLL